MPGIASDDWGVGNLDREMRLVTLADNSAGLRRGVLAEHGFSAYLEVGDDRLIFDAGTDRQRRRQRSGHWGSTSQGFQSLSHGHYDHTGGLAASSRRLAPSPSAPLPPASCPGTPGGAGP
jgi:metal-dependent hydrolase (beta-lactamase superfamily II)